MNAHMGHIIHEVIFGSSVPGGVDLQGSFNPLLEWNKTDVNGRLHQNAFELLQNAWSILLQYTLIEIEYHYQDVACAVACSGVDSRLLYESSSHRVWNQRRAAVLSLPVHICTKSKFSHQTFLNFFYVDMMQHDFINNVKAFVATVKSFRNLNAMTMTVRML